MTVPRNWRNKSCSVRPRSLPCIASSSADIAEFDRAEGWRGDGAVSMIAWVTDQCGVSTSTASQWVRSRDNLETLPCFAEGLARGAARSTWWNLWQRWRPPRPMQVVAEAAAIGVCARRVSLLPGTAQKEAAERGGRRRIKGTNRRRCGRALLGSSTAAHCASTTSRRTVWVAFTKDDYAVAKSALVANVSAEMRTRRDRADAGSQYRANDPKARLG